MKSKDYLLTFVAIGIAIGFYYCNDMLQATETFLKQHPYFLDSKQFNLLYFFTYLAQFLLLIPVGLMVDSCSLKGVMTGLITTTLFAQIILGILLSQRADGYVTLMYITRGIFGISGLGIITIQGKLIDKFSKKHYEYIMGLCLNIPYLFNALNSFITASVQKQTENTPLCYFIGAIFCGISLLFAIFVIFKYLSTSEQYHQQQTIIHQESNGWKIIKSFKVQFWVLLISIFFTEGSINSMIDNLSDFITKTFGIKSTTVGNLVPILFIFLTPFSIVLGKLIQCYPAQKRNLMVLGRVLYLVALVVLYMMPKTDAPTSVYNLIVVVFLLLMSFNWAIFHSILQPCISYYVQQQHLGVAWGIVGSVLGLCQSFFSFINIQITSSSKSMILGYSHLLLCYIIVTSLSILIALWVRFRSYQRLDKTFEQNCQDFDSLKNQQ